MSFVFSLLWSIPSIILYCVIFVYVQGLMFGYIRPPAFLATIANPWGAFRRWRRRRDWLGSSLAGKHPLTTAKRDE